MSVDLSSYKGTPGQAPWYQLYTGLIDELNAQFAGLEIGAAENLLDNGDFLRSDRSPTYTGTGSGVRSVDRWHILNAGGNSATVGISAREWAGLWGQVQPLQINIVNPITGFHIAQGLEEWALALTSKRWVRLSFLARADAAITLDDVRVGQRTDSATIDTGFDNATIGPGWQRYSSVRQLPQSPLADGVTYLAVYLGSTLAAVNWTNVKFANICLSVGTFDPLFRSRHPSIELERCARYYQRTGAGYEGAAFWQGSTGNTQDTSTVVRYRTPLRTAADTIVIYDETENNFDLSTDSVTDSGTDGFKLTYTSNQTDGDGQSWFEANWTAEAEIPVA